MKTLICQSTLAITEKRSDTDAPPCSPSVWRIRRQVLCPKLPIPCPLYSPSTQKKEARACSSPLSVRNLVLAAFLSYAKWASKPSPPLSPSHLSAIVCPFFYITAGVRVSVCVEHCMCISPHGQAQQTITAYCSLTASQHLHIITSSLPSSPRGSTMNRPVRSNCLAARSFFC